MAENGTPPEPPKPEPPPNMEQNIEQQAEASQASTPTVGGEIPTADHQQAELKAQQSAASQVDGLHQTANALDNTQAKEPFGQAAGIPTKQPPQSPQQSLQLNTPAPGGGGHVSPQLRDSGDQSQDAREAFKKQMLARKEFRENARDVTDRDR